MRREQIIIQLVALAEAFAFDFSPSAQALYLDALEELTEVQLRTACARAMRELRFFPRAAELRDLAGVSSPALEAWDQVLGCLSRGGGWAELPIATRRALAAIGGSSRVTTADDQRGLGALRPRFVDAFTKQRDDSFKPALPSAVRVRVGSGK